MKLSTDAAAQTISANIMANALPEFIATLKSGDVADVSDDLRLQARNILHSDGDEVVREDAV